MGAATQIVVAGQGRVGLPLAVRAAEVGHRVVGCDVDPHRDQQLTAGQSYVEDVASSRLRAVLDSGPCVATAGSAAPAAWRSSRRCSAAAQWPTRSGAKGMPWPRWSLVGPGPRRSPSSRIRTSPPPALADEWDQGMNQPPWAHRDPRQGTNAGAALIF
ncbi:hypothetical protein [Streptomyces echinatus]|uniref:hypothetical protein n=1 Tax=Streptomyces echinatus TaxID=67293 RepID=UPI0037BACAD0